MLTPEWAAGVDISRASSGRIYDYLLGGTHNFAVDREAAQVVLSYQPTARKAARANRAFLTRAVRELAHRRGIRQFLDIGSGIPTSGNVHEVAQTAAPDARVLYVDIDPTAVLHGMQILEDNDGANAMIGDVRQPDQMLSQIADSPELHKIIDLRQPAAVLLVAVLHFVPDDAEAYRAVGYLRDMLAPGSCLVVSHATDAGLDDEAITTAYDLYKANTGSPVVPRTAEQIGEFFGDFELVDPGLAWTVQWRPDAAGHEFGERPWLANLLAGVGCKQG